MLPKDTSSGPFIDEWKKSFGDISKSVEEVDISTAISASALAVKDENELVGRRSSFVTFMDADKDFKAGHAKCFQGLHSSYESILR